MSETTKDFVEHARQAGLVPQTRQLGNTFLRECPLCKEQTPHYVYETFVECAFCRRRTFRAKLTSERQW
jgi:hypothetical protein